MSIEHLYYLSTVDFGHLAMGEATRACQAKFLLVKLIQEIGEGQVINGNQKELAKRLGVSPNLLNDCWYLLVGGGYVLDGSTRIFGGKEKFSGRFRLAMIDKGSKNSNTPIHCVLINNLLVPDNSKYLGSRRHALNLSTRLLLCVLLMNANECGLVTNVGAVELGRLTGLTVNRIRSAIRRLQNLGYIRTVIAGGSSDTFLGKVISRYYLNVSHSAFQDSAVKGLTLLIKIEDAFTCEIAEARQVIRELLLSRRGKSKISNIKIRRNYYGGVSQLDNISMTLLKRAHGDAFVFGLDQHLQSLIEEEASRYINEQLKEDRVGDTIEVLLEAFWERQCQKIKGDFNALIALSLIKHPEGQAVIKLYSSLISALANSVMSFINSISEINADDYNWLILPVYWKQSIYVEPESNREFSSYAVVGVSKGLVSELSSVYEFAWSKESASFNRVKYESEQSLCLQLRYCVSLLSPQVEEERFKKFV